MAPVPSAERDKKVSHARSREGRLGKDGKPASANVRPGEGYTLKGKNSTMSSKKVTTPAPFTSMEMDVLLRQHKADERERVRVLEEEEEAERRERRFKAALQARPTDTHVRLSKDFEVAKAKREALAEKLHADESVTSSFHAKDYKGPGGVDWAVIKERQETERLQRVAARRAWLQNQMQAPRMAGAGKAAHGSRAAEKENAMMAANGTRPRHATVGDDFAASMKKGHASTDPRDVRKRLEGQRAKWEAQMRAKRDQLKKEREEVLRAREEGGGEDKRRMDSFNKRQKEYEVKKLKKEKEKKAAEEAEKAAVKERAEKERKRLMNMKVPDHPRMTHAAALQVEVVRQRQALKDKAAARERKRAEMRRARLREAAEDLKPALDAFDREREPKVASFDDLKDDTDGKEPTFAEKLKQNKKAMEDRVRAKRPSLIERLQVMSARDRAKARSLRNMAGALREAYGNKGQNGNEWLELALKDDLLDPEEVEFLKLAPPPTYEKASSATKGAIARDDIDVDDQIEGMGL